MISGSFVFVVAEVTVAFEVLGFMIAIVVVIVTA